MKKRTFLAAAALSVVLAGTSDASFRIRAQSPRSAGMGNALAAVADDSSALFTNPAGMASLSSAEASFTYTKPYADLPDVNFSVGHMAYVTPTALGRIGVGVMMFEASGLKKEQTIALGYAAPLPRGIQVGLTAKHLHHSYELDSDPLAASDPAFQAKTSKSAVGFDLGVVAPLSELVKVGASVRNLNEPDVGVLVQDRIPREFQVGLLFDVPGMGMKVAGDVFVRRAATGGASPGPAPYLGVEKAIGQAFAFRFGLNSLEMAGGFGVNVRNVRFDYALVLNRNLLADNFGTHKLGMTYRFKSR